MSCKCKNIIENFQGGSIPLDTIFGGNVQICGAGKTLSVENIIGCSPVTIGNDSGCTSGNTALVVSGSSIFGCDVNILGNIYSGGTNLMDIFSSGGSGTDYYTTGFTFNPANYDLTVSLNNGNNLTQNLGILAGDLTVTGGTYNPSNGVATFTNNRGGTFDVTGFLTGYTDTDVFVTGGTYIGNTLEFTNNSGGTFSVTGITGTDYYTTGLTFNSGTYDLTVSLNNGSAFTQSLGILSSDMTITGGTYNPSNGVGTFTNNSGGTFQVTGFLTGYTDIYTTGVTLNGNSIEFDRTDTSNAYSVDLSPILSGFSGTDVFVTGGTYSSSAATITFTNNTGGTFTVTGISGGTGSTSPAGSNTQIQFNDSGSFGANTGFTFDTTSQTLFTESNVSGTSVNFYNGLSNFDVGFGSTEVIGTTTIYKADPIGSTSGVTMFTMGDLTDVFGEDNSYLLGFINATGNTNSLIVGTPESTRIVYQPSDGGGSSNYIAVGYGGITNEILSGKTFEVQGVSNTLLNVNNSGTTFHSAYTFPTTDGNQGQVLKTDGGGSVSWSNGTSGLFAQTGDSTTVSATTGTTTSIIGSGVGEFKFPANTLQGGDTFHIKCGGLLKNIGASGLAFNLSGATELLDTGIIGNNGAVSTSIDRPWELEIDLTIRSTGAIGTAIVVGEFNWAGLLLPGGAGLSVNRWNFHQSSSIDTTVDNALDLAVELGDLTSAIYSQLTYLNKVY